MTEEQERQSYGSYPLVGAAGQERRKRGREPQGSPMRRTKKRMEALRRCEQAKPIIEAYEGARNAGPEQELRPDEALYFPLKIGGIEKIILAGIKNPPSYDDRFVEKFLALPDIWTGPCPFCKRILPVILKDCLEGDARGGYIRLQTWKIYCLSCLRTKRMQADEKSSAIVYR